jgi:hypothetical protein
VWIYLRVLSIDTAISLIVKFILEKLHNQLCKKKLDIDAKDQSFEFLSHKTCNQNLKVFANILVSLNAGIII